MFRAPVGAGTLFMGFSSLRDGKFFYAGMTTNPDESGNRRRPENGR